MADFETIFEDLQDDVDTELIVEGALPDGFAGTFYAIGGAGTRIGNTVLHTFDAHGRVTAARIENGKASLRARMVKTPLYEAERAAGAMVKRRVFTNKPGRWSNLFNLDIGNNCMHNVVSWGEHLVAAQDPGFFLIDPVSLETRGPAPIRPRKGATFTPMVRRDPRTGWHVLFEQRPGRRDVLIVRELDDAFSVKKEHTFKLPRGATLLHDITFTDRFYIVAQLGSLSLPKILWGARPLFEALTFDPKATPTLYLLPREGGNPIAIPLPGGRTHFHFWNAFDEDNHVHVDAIGYEGAVRFSSAYPSATRESLGVKFSPTPTPSNRRYVIDLDTQTASAEALTDLPAEPPEIRPDRRGGRYRFGWAPTRGGAGDEEDAGAYPWFHGLARHDFEARSTQVWDAGPRAYVSPVSFVPRKDGTGEDDGWIVAWIQDAANRSASLGVFDARNISTGPIAQLRAPAMVGMISHVTFA
ncbi:MAG: carotenoid oxygenase family protein [bacterium]